MNAYEPVNCDFHDQLEALATLHQDCQVTYRNETGQPVEVQTRIVDVFTRDQAEFCKIQDGTEIRLDRLIAVDGRSQSDYAVEDTVAYAGVLEEGIMPDISQ